MITATGLTKCYGDTTAVDDLSFDVQPGIVTGFLGPNGAGKTTTMRLILGLDAPTAGAVTIDGHVYRDTPAPMQAIGALIDPSAVHADAPPTITCSGKPRPAVFRRTGSTRCSRLLA